VPGSGMNEFGSGEGLVAGYELLGSIKCGMSSLGEWLFAS
jgi:hypothetical protein